jgi:ketosteroid isomerase-like protein
MSATAASTNLESVQAIYEAFGRGDLQTIIDAMSDDVAWEAWPDNTAQREGVPLLQPRHGKQGVQDFFAEVARFEIGAFEVRDMMASDRQVTVDVRIDVTGPDGGRYVDEELHLYTFGDDGKIVRMRHYVDTAKHIAASRGEDTAAG